MKLFVLLISIQLVQLSLANKDCPPSRRKEFTGATYGGNSNGAKCVFPFTYLGTSYNECITDGNGGVDWCATTDNYKTDGKWGNCNFQYTIYTLSEKILIGTSGGNANGAPCQFPFNYNGETYEECTAANNNGVEWCYGAQFGKWGNCVYEDAEHVVIETAGGNANGAPCQFPFTYGGQSYNECITAYNNGVKWCATTDDYSRDKLWGNCEL